MPTSCVLLPHGVYSLLPTVLTTLGWLAALFEDGCNYALVYGAIVSEVSLTDSPYLEVGLRAYREPVYNVDTGKWGIVGTGKCIEYPEIIDTDGYWKVANGFQFAALVLGGGATFYLWISTCCRFSRGSWRWAGYEVAAASIFQLVSFIWFKTALCQENDCELFYGSKADIMASVFWLVAALLILFHYPEPKELGDGDGIMSDEDENDRGTSSRPNRQRRRRLPRRVDDELSILSPPPTSADFPPMQDEEMPAGQDSRQNGNNKDLDDVKLT